MKNSYTSMEHTHIRSNAVAMLAGACMFVMSVASPAFSQQYDCEHLPTAVYEEHKRLYEHALIAGFPYSQKPQNTCSVDDISQRIIGRFVSMTEADLNVNYVLEFGDLKPDDVGVYSDQSGHTYISCRNDSRNDLLRIFVNVASDRGGVFRFHVLVEAQSFLFLRENINFHMLQSTNGDEIRTFDLEMVVIENANSLGEILAALEETIRNSCTFDFMAYFVEYQIKRREENESVTVVGHSLGGAVTQHIAQHISENNAANAVTFRGYSFSSFGLDSGGKTSITGVFSYYIWGDPVVELLSVRDQIGKVIRYNPSIRYNPPWHLLSRHYLVTVQNEICRCIKRRPGSLTIK